jgi:hypothetical protein
MCRIPVNMIRVAAVVAALGIPVPRAHGAEGEVAIKPMEAWGCVFGGRKVELHFAVVAQRAVEGRVAWGLAVERGTVARGEAAVVAGPQKPGEVTVRLDLPEAREGVVVPAVLSLAVESPGRAGNPIASLEKRLWIFPENPFALRTRWLEQLDIRLFDPGQKTQRVLEKMKVPFRETRNVDSLAVLDKGLVIIGEGTSLSEYRGLAKMMVTAASRGTSVICLAPSGGEMAMPGSEGSDLPAPASITLRRNDVISTLDKRLDALAWPADGNAVASRLLIKGDRNRVVAEVGGSEEGWPWVEIGFLDRAHVGQVGNLPHGGKLVVCGFAVVRKWDEGPVPRFLLLRLMEHLAAEPNADGVEPAPK